MEHHRLLLLNTTNHPVRLAYPYAFVQVSEVGRRHAIDTRRVDLFGIAPAARLQLLRRVLSEYRPSLIGVTLRNTDSLLSTDYVRLPQDGPIDRPNPRNLLEQLTEGAPPYFPTHDTRDLIALLRTLSPALIVLGGFGFTTQPHALMQRLAPDFGVLGDPEPVFARIEDLLQRRNLEQIDNLCFFENGQLRVNRRVLHGPAANREYDDSIIADRERLFGAFTARLPATSRAVPVEVMRGCPYRCTFCAEPAVKGNRALVRDLDVVVDELEFLHSHQLNLIWFVCSEINAMGSAFALELAERIVRLNERRSEAERVRWYTYYLLRFSRDELRTLRRAGFLGGWNDIPAFDDRNLKQLRVPYRTRHLVQSIADVTWLRGEEAPARDPGAALEEKLVHDPEHRRSMLPDDMLTSPMLTLFLGNPAATIETVRETIRVANVERFAASFDGAFVIRAERVFTAAGRDGAVDDGETSSYDRVGETALDYVNPTFRFSSALVRQLGSRAALERFFVYVEDTFLSRNHLFRQDWCWFLSQHTTSAAIHRIWGAAHARSETPLPASTLEAVRAVLEYVTSDPNEERIRLLFSPPLERRRAASRAADLVLQYVLPAAVFETLRVRLGLAVTLTDPHAPVPYELTVALYARFGSDQELAAFVSNDAELGQEPLAQLALAALLYRNNVQLRPEYRPFFIAAGDEQSRDWGSAAPYQTESIAP